MTTTTNSPQSQAEALAVEVIKEWRLTGNALVSCISTALEKLLTENERLKAEAHSNDCPVVGERDALQSQLTATEAKLETAIGLLEKVSDADDQCDCYQSMMNGKHYEDCPTELARQSKAFLSTLTSAKKEEAK